MASQDPHAAQLQQARDLITQDEREQALALLYAVVAVEPAHVEAWWLIARATPHTLPRQEALQRVLALDPDHEGAQALARRLGQFNVPTAIHEKPPAQDPAPLSSTPSPPVPSPAPDYSSAPPSAPPPAPDYRPAPAYEPPPPPLVEREVVYVERERRQLQPFLVVNGGCSSGCFSVILTVIVVSVLAFLLIGDSVSGALRSVGALDVGEAIPARLLPTVALTAIMAFLRANPVALPIDLGSLVGSGDSASTLAEGISSLWTSAGFPPNTGDAILARLTTVGAQLSSVGWIAIGVFLLGWVVLAFVFVFLRARSGRFLHWFLSTVGLWILFGLACGLGNLIYQLVFVAP